MRKYNIWWREGEREKEQKKNLNFNEVGPQITSLCTGTGDKFLLKFG